MSRPGDAWGVVPGAGPGTGHGGYGDRLLFGHGHGRRHEYKYLAADLFTDRAISELPIRDSEFGWSVNKPGEFSGSVAVPTLGHVRSYFDATRPARTVLYVIRDGVPVWGGIIWKRSFNSDERLLKIEADTFDSYMYHRILDKTFRFIRDLVNSDPAKRHEGVEQIEAFRTLWRHMVSGKGSDIRVRLGDTVSPVRRGLFFSGWEFKTYGEHIDELIKKPDSFEWIGTVGLSASGESVDRRIEFAYPKFGRKWAESKLIWEFPGWALKYGWDADADKAATAVYVLGGGDGVNKAYAGRLNENAINEGWPRLDESRPHDKVWSQDILRSHAGKYLVAYSPPINSFTMTIHPKMPLEFGDYFIGDEVRLVIDDELFRYANVSETDLLARIKGLKVRPNAEGLEEVTPEMVIAIRDLQIIDPDDESSDLVPDNWPGVSIDAPDLEPVGGPDDGIGPDGDVFTGRLDPRDATEPLTWQRGLLADPSWDPVRYWGGSYE